MIGFGKERANVISSCVMTARKLWRVVVVVDN
jgi:hypothetical protein